MRTCPTMGPVRMERKSGLSQTRETELLALGIDICMVEEEDGLWQGLGVASLV